MKRPLICAALGAALVLAPAAMAAASKARAVAKLSGLDGSAMGTVTFTTTSHGVLMQFDLKGLTPGVHGIHIHTSGNCDAKVAFTSAGPHFSPAPGKMHGYLAPHGIHAGDLPNEFAATDGTLRAIIISNAFSIGNGKKSIFDRDGASIIIDARGDDYFSQPSGNAGDRVACGVIMRTIAPGSRKGGAHRTHK